MIKLFTIGFTEKTAEQFFSLMQQAGVKKLVDTRINTKSQLAGFAKDTDLRFFTNRILGIPYEYRLQFAPTKDLLARYRDGQISWTEYEKEYLQLLKDRRILDSMDFSELDGACLLCSEHTPENCHRRLLAEYLKRSNSEIQIIHLVE